MAGNNSIQFLRGTRNQIAQNTQQLQDGQPLYNMTDNYLSIGGGDSNALNKLPIACRELKGYVTDLSDGINNVTEGTTEQWSIKYEKGKGLQFDNSVQYQGNSIVFSNGSLGTQNGNTIPSAKTLGIQSAAFGGLRWDYVNESEDNWGRTPTSAEGNQSFAFGGSTHAYGDWSIAGGKDTKAYQRATVALGGGSKAGRSEEEFNDYFYKDGASSNGGKGLNSEGSILDSEGNPYIKSYSYAASFGELNNAYGRASFASGSSNSVADYGFAVGKNLIADYEQITFGKYNNVGFTSTDATRTIFSIGDGVSDSIRRNTLELTRNCMFQVGRYNSFGSQWNTGCMLFGQDIKSSSEDNFGFYFGKSLKSNVKYYQPHLVIGSGQPENISDNYFYSLSVFNGGSSPAFGVQPDGLVVTHGIRSVGHVQVTGNINAGYINGYAVRVNPVELQGSQISLGFGGNQDLSLSAIIPNNGSFKIKSLDADGNAGPLQIEASNITTDVNATVTIPGELLLIEKATKGLQPVRLKEFEDSLQKVDTNILQISDELNKNVESVESSINTRLEQTLWPISDIMKSASGLETLAKLLIGTASESTFVDSASFYYKSQLTYSGIHSTNKLIIAQTDYFNSRKNVTINVQLQNRSGDSYYVDIYMRDITQDSVSSGTNLNVTVGVGNASYLFIQQDYEYQRTNFVNTLYIYTSENKVFKFEPLYPTQGSSDNVWILNFDSSLAVYNY